MALLDRPAISYHQDLRSEQPRGERGAKVVEYAERGGARCRKAAFSTSVNDQTTIFV